MTKVGIKELNLKLSEYVQRARKGEQIVVMDGDEAVAELISLNPVRLKALEAVERGELSWNGGKPKGARGLVVRGEPMSDTVIRARG
jgi:antitoxin (DNA-binding transcriptional repressor) of toxin-antitoxin stability system